MQLTTDAQEEVTLVDDSNAPMGVMGKLAAHEQGLLHRAFSIFLFSPDGRTLMQRRALSKYHSGGEWANTCCGHPRPNEPILDAAHRRLFEEMGMSAALTEAFQTRYTATLDNDMIENEYVHVFVGLSEQTPQLNPLEACDYSYQHLNDLLSGDTISKDGQTVWMRHYLENHFEQLLASKHIALDQTKPSRLQAGV
jgi:isopentenyl-diphosphate delta-isomerase